ncbi:MAG: rod shape-determining protein MreC [Balneolaceae bacterium]|nr:rod shape-determining protein MreC [Balneolaceae bacterium]
MAQPSNGFFGRDTLLGAFLLLLSILMMVLRFDDGLRHLRQASLAVVSRLEAPLSNVRVFRQALNTNRELQRQNILLQDELNRLRSAETQNSILRDLINFQDGSTLDLLPVQFESKSIFSPNPTGSITAGTEQNVGLGNAVIHPQGIVGRVILTTKQRAQVMFYSHPNFRVSAKIMDSRATGILRWNLKSNETMILDYVPLTIPVQVGQEVATSGFSQQFPENIPIGIVESAERQSDQSTWLITVTPSVDLNRLAEGFVVQNTTDPIDQDPIDQDPTEQDPTAQDEVDP